ncbi:MAG: hypothetical protein UW69_C0064G0014 [Microgenomates group bacterium GW2011_GWA2_44_7]|nr:MAG: hypothetical protein UW69_C0064G0014 [Microgenomates group bacterium GW2011_GWA2_44_7]KKT77839.1 MAG: hypothetical protein UW73_C0011G0038 [Microgenomates group bacterium GW2011_GWB1_44_8]
MNSFKVNDANRPPQPPFELLTQKNVGEIKVGKGQKTFLLMNMVEPAKFRLTAEGADLTILGLMIAEGNQEQALTVEVIHEKPRTKAVIILKAVVFSKAKVNIKGSVKINKGAKMAEDFLREDVMLVGKEAKGEAYPYLEIEENEVIAKHAATVGRLNNEQLFYLMSRGLSLEESSLLLARGFLTEILERIPSEVGGKIDSQLTNVFKKRNKNGYMGKYLQGQSG